CLQSAEREIGEERSEQKRPQVEPRCQYESREEHAIRDFRWRVHFAISDGDLCRLPGFFLGALLQSGFTRKFDPPFVVNADAFYPDHVAGFHDVFGSLDAEIGQLGNVDEAFLTWKNFDKTSELFRGNDPALISLADLDFLGHATNDFLRA